jgi:hypothetical protein
MSCCVLTLAALLAAPADPPPADTCCLTYGQVQVLIADKGYIAETEVSQCLATTATKMSAYPTPENKNFLFVPDQTVGVSPEKDGRRALCIQWEAVEKAVKARPGIQLLYDGKPFEGKELQQFHKTVKRGDVVILVMRYVKKDNVCELAQIHVVPIAKVKPAEGKDKN